MTKKIKYVAILANGDMMHRASVRPLTHFWRVAEHKTANILGQGFCGSADLAEKAARKVRRAYHNILTTVEIVQTRTVDAHLLESRLVEHLPFRVFYQWKGSKARPRPVTASGNKSARFETERDARAYVLRQQLHREAFYHSAILTIVDDRAVDNSSSIAHKQLVTA